MTIMDAKLDGLGIVLPHAAAPVANYVTGVVSGGMLYISGQIPFDPDGVPIRGRLGDTMTTKEGAAAAARCGVGLIAQMKSTLGSLDRVARIVKLGVFVASTSDFTDHPKVANGASDLMVAVFGENGRHARSAVGVAALPLGVAVEIDAIIAVDA